MKRKHTEKMNLLEWTSHWIKRLDDLIEKIQGKYIGPRPLSEIKWFLQRGWRGYADCDLWSMDDWLAEMLPRALRQLKENKHGTPIICFPEEYRGWYEGDAPDGMHETAVAKWDGILNSMIKGFEAHRELEDLNWDDEIDRVRLTKVRDEGLLNFITYFGNLWD